MKKKKKKKVKKKKKALFIKTVRSPIPGTHLTVKRGRACT